MSAQHPSMAQQYSKNDIPREVPPLLATGGTSLITTDQRGMDSADDDDLSWVTESAQHPTIAQQYSSKKSNSSNQAVTIYFPKFIEDSRWFPSLSHDTKAVALTSRQRFVCKRLRSSHFNAEVYWRRTFIGKDSSAKGRVRLRSSQLHEVQHGNDGAVAVAVGSSWNK
jgi:hypothetical protein